MLFNKKHIYLRSPLRISFVGGGTDLESFYEKGVPGHVISSTTDLYVYVSLKDMFDSNVRVHHSEIETEPITSRIRHIYSKTALEHYGMFKGSEVVITSDVMTTGSGLGASSSMMSALLRGCSEMRGKKIKDNYKLAELTYKLEHEAGNVGGRQDQYAAAFGGLNSITFSKEKIKVTPVKISNPKLKDFEDRLFLIFTNIARASKDIQIQLQDNSRDDNKNYYFENLLNLSYEFLKTLQSKNSKIDDIGRILHEAWLLKKRTNKSSTNPYIDQLYDSLRKKGVTGGKILGAGGGGFFLAFAKDPDIKKKIKYTLYPNFITLDVKFSKKGTEVLWKNF